VERLTIAFIKIMSFAFARIVYRCHAT